MKTMKTMKTTLSALLLVASSAASGGCYAVSNLDRFEQASDTPAPSTTGKATSAYRDLRLTLLNMKPHAAQRFEYRVVSDDNQILSMGLLLPLGARIEDDGVTVDPVVINIANAVPRQGNLRLDFFSDVNDSGGYDGIGEVKDKKDHAWRIAPLNDIDPSFGQVDEDLIDISFTHNMIFTDIDRVGEELSPAKATGADATVRLVNMANFTGKLVEVRVVERSTGHVTGLCRYPVLPEGDVVTSLAGVLDPGVDYDVEIYADSNGDLSFQPTGTDSGDGGWRLGATASDSGFDVTLDPSTMSPQAGVLFSYLVGARDTEPGRT